jgi:hypothetical protein
MQRGCHQPRRDMQPEALEELANSIRPQGIMQRSWYARLRVVAMKLLRASLARISVGYGL